MTNHQHTQSFILTHLHADVHTLLLQKTRFPNVDWAYAIAQIEGRQRAQQKLPSFAENMKIVFPKKIALEQCSSQLTAQYKAQFTAHKRILDATGGFGVDSFYFSKQAQSVVYVEQQDDLCEIVQQNFEQLNAQNIAVVNENVIEFLQKNPARYDLIYLDPARRGAHNSKKFLLSDCEPNVLNYLDFLFEKTDELLIKVSPMLDISLAMEQLCNIAEIHVVSVKNECKELLFRCKKNTEFRGITAVNLAPQNICSLSFLPEEERLATPVYTDFSKHFPKYLYDPFTCLTKAGAFKILCSKFGVEKISQHAHLYTSQEYVPDFPGRHFRVMPYDGNKISTETTLFSPFPITPKSFANAPINNRANIVCKHFPQTPDEIRKRYKIADGGACFLFFTTTSNHQKICILAKFFEENLHN